MTTSNSRSVSIRLKNSTIVNLLKYYEREVGRVKSIGHTLRWLLEGLEHQVGDNKVSESEAFDYIEKEFGGTGIVNKKQLLKSIENTDKLKGMEVDNLWHRKEKISRALPSDIAKKCERMNDMELQAIESFIEMNWSFSDIENSIDNMLAKEET